MNREGLNWSPETGTSYEVPVSEITVETTPLRSSKKLLGTKIELTWDSKKNKNPQLRTILDQGKTQLNNYFSKGGRQLGQIVLQVEVDAEATDEKIKKTEQDLRQKLNGLVAEAISGQSRSNTEFVSGFGVRTRKIDKGATVKGKRVAASRQRGSFSARRMVDDALADVGDLN